MLKQLKVTKTKTKHETFLYKQPIFFCVTIQTTNQNMRI